MPGVSALSRFRATLKTARRNTAVSAAKSLSLLVLSIVSASSAAATHRALQNHWYAVGLSRSASGEGDTQRMFRQFLNVSTKISIVSSFVQYTGGVFLGVSLLAEWRSGAAWGDRVLFVSCACFLAF